MKRFHGSIVILIILIVLCWPAALVYFLLKYDDVTPEYPTRTCLGCGANVPWNYQVCPYCGKPLGQGPQYYHPPQPAGAAAPTKTCTNCHAAMGDADVFCQNCGTKQ